jgi:hypothetical protein
VKEDEKPVVVGKGEPSGSGKKADTAANLPCMDRLWEELSCAVGGGVIWLWFDGWLRS